MKKPLAALLFALIATVGHADDGSMEPAVGDIAHRWAKINYHTPAKEQEKAFKDLADQAGRPRHQHASRVGQYERAG